MDKKTKDRKALSIKPFMVRAEDAARLCSISQRTWYSMISSGQAPPSIKLRGIRLWRVDILRKWVEHNCPSIHEFERILENDS